jgi:hypothetical protein
VVGPAGLEPATLGLEIRCSIRLSYGPSTTYEDCDLFGAGSGATVRFPMVRSPQSYPTFAIRESFLAPSAIFFGKGS